MVMTDCNALTTVLFGSSVFSNDFVLTVAGECGVWARVADMPELSGFTMNEKTFGRVRDMAMKSARAVRR